MISCSKINKSIADLHSPTWNTGADPGFQVRGGGGGAHLKKLRRAVGGAKFFGVFRVKNNDFTPKNHIFPILGGAREIFGVFHVKNHDFMPKKSYVFTFVEAKVILNNRYICSHYIPYLNIILKRYKDESLTFFSLYFRTGSLENTVQFV